MIDVWIGQYTLSPIVCGPLFWKRRHTAANWNGTIEAESQSMILGISQPDLSRFQLSYLYSVVKTASIYASHEIAVASHVMTEVGVGSVSAEMAQSVRLWRLVELHLSS